jgi:argininosuccinate synthase
MLLKDGMTRWLSPSVTGSVTVELRRGDDYSILDTRAEHMAYDPHKLSMEKVESAFSPEDRMGALELQNLSVLDNRALLIHHLASLRQLSAPDTPAFVDLLALEDPDRTQS